MKHSFSPLVAAAVLACLATTLVPSDAMACFGEGYEPFHVSSKATGEHEFELPAPEKPVVTGVHSYGESLFESLTKSVQSSAEGYASVGVRLENGPYAVDGGLRSDPASMPIGYIIEHEGGFIPEGVELPDGPVRPASGGYVRLGLVRESGVVFFAPSYFSVRVTPINREGVRGPSTTAHVGRAGKPWSLVAASLFVITLVVRRRRRRLVSQAAP